MEEEREKIRKGIRDKVKLLYSEFSGISPKQGQTKIEFKIVFLLCFLISKTVPDQKERGTVRKRGKRATKTGFCLF